MDGSSPPSLVVRLEGPDELAIPAKARIVPLDGLSDAAATCLANARPLRPLKRVIARIGVYGESVTFRDRSSTGLYACDNSAGMREGDRPWCGTAFGRLRNGRLSDPGLDIGCTTPNGDPVGFVWVEPSVRSRYLVVEQPGFVEVHVVVGDLPVRVSAIGGVRLDGSRARFEVREHDRRGRLLRRYRIEAAVAG